MFDKQYRFYGRHAIEAVQLTFSLPYPDNPDPNDKSIFKLFKSNIELYLIASLVGFLYGRKSDIDTTSKEDSSIFPEQFSNFKSKLVYNYRLIMLLDKEYEPDEDKRIDKAFRMIGKPEAKNDEELFESYVRGGVDVLYEKLIEKDGDNTIEKLLKRLFDFLEEFNERFNENVKNDEIIKICQKGE
jgi:hypothetical protein